MMEDGIDEFVDFLPVSPRYKEKIAKLLGVFKERKEIPVAELYVFFDNKIWLYRKTVNQLERVELVETVKRGKNYILRFTPERFIEKMNEIVGKVFEELGIAYKFGGEQ